MDFRQDQIIFSLILVFWLVLLAVIFAGAANVNILQFVLAACSIICAVVGYILGLIPGLFASLVFIFFYGTYLLYEVLVTGSISELRVDYVIWLFAIPLETYLAGRLSGEVSGLFWQLERNKLSSSFITIDELTGFLNHQAFFNRLEEEVSRCRRFKTTLSVVVAIISNLSEMQAIYGKKGIEEILKAISRAVNDVTRVIDIKAIINSETFGFILIDTPLQGAAVVEEKLNRSMERITINLNGKKKVIKLRVRIGKAELNSGEEDSLVLYDRAMENTRYDMG
jgi:diguanylate cyclase (GGDEF)-like protein